MENLNQAQYAQHRGVSRQAVNKLVKAGKIPVDKNGRINAADADHALGENQERVDAREPKAPTGDAVQRGGSDTAGLTKAKTVTEVYTARMAQLRYERAVGEVVPAAGIAAAAASCGESVVRILGGLSSRAEENAAAAQKDGVAGARTWLKAMERELRAKLSDAFTKMAADAAAGSPGEMETEDEIDGPSVQA